LKTLRQIVDLADFVLFLNGEKMRQNNLLYDFGLDQLDILADHVGDANLKGYGEFAAHRAQGWHAWLMFSLSAGTA
jgi:hypothetical protein